MNRDRSAENPKVEDNPIVCGSITSKMSVRYINGVRVTMMVILTNRPPHWLAPEFGLACFFSGYYGITMDQYYYFLFLVCHNNVIVVWPKSIMTLSGPSIVIVASLRQLQEVIGNKQVSGYQNFMVFVRDLIYSAKKRFMPTAF